MAVLDAYEPVVATADGRMGIAVLGAMADLGWSSPLDLAVVDADHFTEGEFVVPALTSVYLPLTELRTVASDWLNKIHDLLAQDLDAECAVRQSS